MHNVFLQNLKKGMVDKNRKMIGVRVLELMVIATRGEGDFELKFGLQGSQVLRSHPSNFGS